MKLTAKVRRDGRFWFVTVPEVPHLITQGRSIAEVPEMVADQAATRTGLPESDFDVTVELDDPEVIAALQRAQELAAEADRLRAESAEERRRAARILQGKGATVRDIGALLNISYQRAGQLVTGK